MNRLNNSIRTTVYCRIFCDSIHRRMEMFLSTKVMTHRVKYRYIFPKRFIGMLCIESTGKKFIEVPQSDISTNVLSYIQRQVDAFSID